MSPYKSNDFWYEKRQATTAVTSDIVLALVRSILPFESAVDIGCGIGTWLDTAKRHGAQRVMGYDGNHVPREQLRISPAEFEAIDLATTLPKSETRYDLSVSLEVAEHLPPEQGPKLVDTLCALADNVLFSAAIPGQGGNGHINERPQSYWCDLFKQNDYKLYDFVRPVIWNNSDLPAWYCQNILFFSRTDMKARLSEVELEEVPASMCDIVHPRVFAPVYKRADSPGIMRSVALLRRAVSSRLSRSVK